jgi:putative PIN family toxin of toxin-antitoxin system
MIRAVLDISIIVSAFWSENSDSADILRMFADNRVLPCYDARIMAEYKAALSRPRLAFRKSGANVAAFVASMQLSGFPVSARPSAAAFADESNRKFYDVAKACEAILITGDARSYPAEPFVTTAAGFLAKYG